MRPIINNVIAISSWALLLSGCAGTRAPQLEVVQVSVTERTEDAVQLQFDLELSNPNDEPLELRHFEYDLSVAGNPVYAGKRAAEATLNRGAKRRISIPAVVRHEQAGDLSSGRADGSIDYHLRGTLIYLSPGTLADILLDAGLRRPKVHFEHKGDIAAGP